MKIAQSSAPYIYMQLQMNPACTEYLKHMNVALFGTNKGDYTHVTACMVMLE